MSIFNKDYSDYKIEGENYLSEEEEKEIDVHVRAIEAIVNRYPMHYPLRSRPPKDFFQKEKKQ